MQLLACCPMLQLQRTGLTRGLQEHFNVAPGLHLKVQTYSEILRLTVAYAAAASLLRALVEWRELHAAGEH